VTIDAASVIKTDDASRPLASIGPHGNGEPCVAGVNDDPLEAICVRLLERAPA